MTPYNALKHGSGADLASLTTLYILRGRNVPEPDTVGPILSERVTQRQFEAVGRIDYAIVVVGRFEYEDIYGNLYQTDFCNGTSIQVKARDPSALDSMGLVASRQLANRTIQRAGLPPSSMLLPRPTTN